MTSGISSLRGVEAMAFLRSVADRALDQKTAVKPVITLSRDIGAGGEEVGDILAERLGVPVLDKDLFDKVANLAGTDKYLLEMLQERTSSLKQEWMVSLFTGQNLLEQHYRQCLVDTILATLAEGGIIIGRGAHVVLAHSPVLRVRLVGTVPVCAKRLAAKEGIDLEAATKQVEETNHHRGEFVWHHFKSRLNDPSTFDLVVNTDRLNDWEKVADMILDAGKVFGIRPLKK